MADFKELRNKIGLTQSELAEKVGVSENTIQNWEGGKITPKGDNLKRYLRELGVTDHADMAKIAAASYIGEVDDVDNIPYFLFEEGSIQIEKIKACSATAEELDMLGYEQYVTNYRGKYAKREMRTENRYPLEFSFFERYGGFNTTMKKLSDVKSRLGSLWIDALEYAEKNPGFDYKLATFNSNEIIDKIGQFIGRKDLGKEIEYIYDTLKTVEFIGIPYNAANMKIRMEREGELNQLLQSNCMSGERRLGRYEGYIYLGEDNSQEKPTAQMLHLTERGKQMIQWIEENEEK